MYAIKTSALGRKAGRSLRMYAFVSTRIFFAGEIITLMTAARFLDVLHIGIVRPRGMVIMLLRLDVAAAIGFPGLTHELKN